MLHQVTRTSSKHTLRLSGLHSLAGLPVLPQISNLSALDESSFGLAPPFGTISPTSNPGITPTRPAVARTFSRDELSSISKFPTPRLPTDSPPLRVTPVHMSSRRFNELLSSPPPPPPASGLHHGTTERGVGRADDEITAGSASADRLEQMGRLGSDEAMGLGITNATTPSPREPEASESTLRRYPIGHGDSPTPHPSRAQHQLFESERDDQSRLPQDASGQRILDRPRDERAEAHGNPQGRQGSAEHLQGLEQADEEEEDELTQEDGVNRPPYMQSTTRGGNRGRSQIPKAWRVLGMTEPAEGPSQGLRISEPPRRPSRSLGMTGTSDKPFRVLGILSPSGLQGGPDRSESTPALGNGSRSPKHPKITQFPLHGDTPESQFNASRARSHFPSHQDFSNPDHSTTSLKPQLSKLDLDINTPSPRPQLSTPNLDISIASSRPHLDPTTRSTLQTTFSNTAQQGEMAGVSNTGSNRQARRHNIPSLPPRFVSSSNFVEGHPGFQQSRNMNTFEGHAGFPQSTRRNMFDGSSSAETDETLRMVATRHQDQNRTRNAFDGSSSAETPSSQRRDIHDMSYHDTLPTQLMTGRRLDQEVGSSLADNSDAGSVSFYNRNRALNIPPPMRSSPVTPPGRFLPPTGPLPSLPGDAQTSAELLTHPPHPRYQHQFRMVEDESGRRMMVPEYQYSPGNTITRRDANDEPLEGTTTSYTHPRPLSRPVHNPFVSTPPPLVHGDQRVEDDDMTLERNERGQMRNANVASGDWAAAEHTAGHAARLAAGGRVNQAVNNRASEAADEAVAVSKQPIDT